MKIFSVILSFHILFLSAAPALSAFVPFATTQNCKSSCCKMHKEGKKKSADQPPKNCCNDTCNPFMSCCNCYALTSQAQSVSTQLTGLNQKLNFLKEVPASSYISTPWHPPKIV